MYAETFDDVTGVVAPWLNTATSVLLTLKLVSAETKACVVRDANMGHQLAGGNSSWCPELESRTTHRSASVHEDLHDWSVHQHADIKRFTSCRPDYSCRFSVRSQRYFSCKYEIGRTCNLDRHVGRRRDCWWGGAGGLPTGRNAWLRPRVEVEQYRKATATGGGSCHHRDCLHLDIAGAHRHAEAETTVTFLSRITVTCSQSNYTCSHPLAPATSSNETRTST